MPNQKMKPPENYKIEIEARIQEQIHAEVTGNIAALYDFILPAIREKRERERTDEPQLTINSITVGAFSNYRVSSHIRIIRL